MNNQTIKISNKLIEGRFNLSAMEKRVFYLILTELQRQEHELTDPNTGEYVDLRAVLKRHLVLKGAEGIESQVKAAIKKLMGNVVEFEIEEGKPWKSYPLLAMAEWHLGGDIIVEVRKDMIPHLIDAKNKYTIIGVVAMISLSSIGSQRMYELCCKYRGVGGFTRSLEELKKSLGVSDKYSQFGAFNNRVLSKACEDIKHLFDENMSDFYFEYSVDKKDTRSVQSIKFKILFKENKPAIDISNKDKYDLLKSIVYDLNVLFEADKKKGNAEFVFQTSNTLLLNPDLIPHIYSRMKALEGKPMIERQKLTRYIINEDCLKKEKS